uniref:Uncharacterized protein n=1 Tax=Rousettus aegyptiacus TaxID=9407 RepID=A0A7J8FIJ8_ROUAE|nr:hypothetical protein HJG63_011972 [Rousettus aegyptiacus]
MIQQVVFGVWECSFFFSDKLMVIASSLYVCSVYKIFHRNTLLSTVAEIYIPRGRVVGSYVNSMFIFLGNYQTVFHTGCTILLSYHQCMSVPMSTHFCQHLLLFVFLVMLVGVKLYLIAALNCFSLITNEVEHLFMHILAICMSSLEK